MCKNLSEIAAHKKGLWSEVVVPKKHFFFVVYCNRREMFFPEYSVSLFHESGYGYCIYFRRALAAMNCVYTMSLTDISKEHLQPYTWVVPLLFQEATCSDLIFSRVLCFFEISTCNHRCFQGYWVNSPFQLQSSIRRMVLFFFLLLKSGSSHTLFQIYCIFSEQEEIS